MSAGQLSPRPRVFKRGGKRDRSARVSANLPDREVQRMLAAIRAAQIQGWHPNRFLTIHWEKQGVPHGEGGRATSALMDKIRRAMDKRGLPFAYVWLRENSGYGGVGDHVHIVYHAKPYSGFAKAMERWIASISGQPYRRKSILTRTVGRSLKAPNLAPQYFEANLATVAGYLLKGVSAGTGKALGVKEWGKGGPVIGQRIGMSKNLARLIPRQPVSL